MTRPTAKHGWPRASLVTARSSRRCSTSPTTSRTGRSCTPSASCVTTATTPTSSWPPTRAPRRSPTSRTRSRWGRASGSATRSRPVALRATTTRPWASPRGARGSRSSATSARWVATARPRTSRSSVSGTCRVTSSATGCCCRHTSGSLPRSTTGTCSSTRIRIRRPRSPSAVGCSTCRARRGRTTTLPCSARAAVSIRGRPSRSR